jgi:hypothetical protein
LKASRKLAPCIEHHGAGAAVGDDVRAGQVDEEQFEILDANANEKGGVAPALVN